MYDGDPRHQAMLARFAAARLAPAMRRLGWNARPGEPANDAVLRADLIETLGNLRDPATLAEASRRFAANDPSVTGGPLRQTILGIVAYNADSAQLGAAADDGARRAQPAGPGAALPIARRGPRRGAGAAGARPRPDRRAGRDQCQPAHLLGGGCASRPRLRFRPAQPRAGRDPGRRVVALALPRRLWAPARPIRR